MARTSKEPITVKVFGIDCVIELRRYPDSGRLAMTLMDKETREEMAVATVNMPEIFLQSGEVLVKTWSENQGVLEALQEAGVVVPTGLTYRSGFVEVPKCLVTVPIEEKFREGQILMRQPERRRTKAPEIDREM